jgi:hypothetical protein
MGKGDKRRPPRRLDSNLQSLQTDPLLGAPAHTYGLRESADPLYSSTESRPSGPSSGPSSSPSGAYPLDPQGGLRSSARPGSPPGIAKSFSGFRTYQRNRAQARPGSHRMSERLMDRDGYFRQSKGVWNISRQGGAWLYAPFYWDDWFHSLLNAPTRRIFFLLFCLYLTFVTCYAACYLYISTAGNEPGEIIGGGCGMDITSFLEAFYFSLETMTTLGYGVQDYCEEASDKRRSEARRAKRGERSEASEASAG